VNTTEAVIQALRYHRQAAHTATGTVCTCGALVALSDFDRHVARQVILAIEDAA
jgi:hypothetical protein